MPTQSQLPSPKVDLAASLGESGEVEYDQLLSVLQDAQGMFALLLVRSNFSAAQRDALLSRLRNDLHPIPLRLVHLTPEHWEAPAFMAEAVSDLPETAVVALIGLENTPGMVTDGARNGDAATRECRPPALAALNHGREALRARCPYPLLIWCNPITYAALREHAPDLFDHFTGLFTFENSAADSAPVRGSLLTDIGPLLLEPAVTALRQPSSARAQVAFYEDRLKRLAEPTLERGRALLGLAEGACYLPGVDPVAEAARAEAAAREALTLLSPETAPQDWARGQQILGLILAIRTTGNRDANLRDAITCFRNALTVYTRRESPDRWADSRCYLGDALARVAGGDRKQQRREAATCYEDSLTVFDEQNTPTDWAAVQNSLGMLHLRPDETGARDLNRASTYFHNALRVYTERNYPLHWASTQVNLGYLRSLLTEQNSSSTTHEEIQHFEAALRVYSEAEFPQDWANLQALLGTVWAYLQTGDGTENLGKAADYLRAALRVQTESNAPAEWAATQTTLGVVLAGLWAQTNRVDFSRQAYEAFIASERGYRNAGFKERANKAAQRAEQVGQLLGLAPQSAKQQRLTPMQLTPRKQRKAWQRR